MYSIIYIFRKKASSRNRTKKKMWK